MKLSQPARSHPTTPLDAAPRVKPKRWVIKVGSSMVCNGGELLMNDWMKQVSELRAGEGIEVIWVSSGAIALAVQSTAFPPKAAKALAEKQALSAIGQPLLMSAYIQAASRQGWLASQILLTYSDLKHPVRRANFQRSVEQLLRWGVLPVLNENDAVATAEIKFGDNDSLSARVALCCGAEQLVILTDVEGLFDCDPKTHPQQAQRIEHLPRVTEALLASMPPGAGSQQGTGGMRSKLLAAQLAATAGIPTWLLKGDTPQGLLQIAQKQRVGTFIGVTHPQAAHSTPDLAKNRTKPS